MPEIDGYAHGDFSWVDSCTEESDKTGPKGGSDERRRREQARAL